MSNSFYGKTMKNLRKRIKLDCLIMLKFIKDM